MDNNFFINNRKQIGEYIENNSMVVLFSGKAPYKSADEKYPFTPNRNFYYLTGINEDSIVLVMTKIKDTVSEFLFIKRYNELQAKWTGETISEECAKSVSGITNIRLIEDFENFVGQQISRGIENIYFDFERREFKYGITESESLAGTIRERYPYITMKNIYDQVAELRTIKSDEEIEKIQRAIDITKEGIEMMMKNAKAGMKEYELEAYFNFTLTKNGVKDKAFPTIAASGKNATVLHYDKNNCTINDGDLILFDLGAQHEYYNADISRTFPINGVFTDRQKQVYSIVLNAQKAVEKACKDGVKLDELNNVCKAELISGCKAIGLINEDSEITKYYYHGVGHHLGLDTHDVGRGDTPLKTGMMITNEPGLYIEEEGIGIRIEDDLLVTEDGCINLSKGILKEIEDIEEFMKK